MESLTHSHTRRPSAYVTRAAILLVSILFVTAAFATPAAAGHVSSDASDWSSTGTASHGVSNAASGGVELTWDNDGGSFTGAWEYTTTATRTDLYKFDWTFQGHHSWFQADAKAYMFADGPGGRTEVLLSDRGGGGFSDSGTASIQVNQGYDFGIRITGSHFDSSRLMHGMFTLTSTNFAPNAALSAPPSADEGASISLDASTSSDTDGSIVSYAWDLDDDGAFDDGTGPTVSTSFDDDGSYTVSVQVTDDGGETDTASAIITVQNVAPAVSVSVSPSNIDEGDSTTLSASYTDPGADTHTATVDWGDGTVETVAASGGSISATHTYAEDGIYLVEVTVTDDDGGAGSSLTTAASFDAADWSSSGTASHGVSNVPGGVELSWNNDGSLSAGSWTYATTSTATGTHEFDWTFRGHHSWFQADAKAYMFADGPGGTTQVLLSDRGGGGFSDSGTASIQVTQGYDFGIKVTGDHFDSSRLMHGTFILRPSPTVVVSNVAPVLSADVDNAADEGSSVSASGSFTDAGVQDTHTVSIDWGDGSTESVAVTQGAGSGSFSGSHAYADDGVYTVMITVTDDDGGSDTYSEDVTISNVAPAVSASGDAIDEGSSATVSATFADPGVQDTHTATIDWGDGSPVESVTPSGGALSASHVYADDGSYTATVTVTDDDGGSGTATATVEVANVAPSVTASASPSNIDEGDSTTLSGSFTDPGADTHTAVVDWGDGTSESLAISAGSFSASHVYADDGAYTATVTVTDDEGDSGTATATVDVANVAPTIDSTDVDDAADEGDLVSASGTFSDPGIQDTHTVTVDWGDGSTDSATVTQGAGSGSFTVDHVYADDGTYTVTMTVTDDEGDSTTATETIEVSNVAPSVTADADDSGVEDTPISLSATFTDPGTADTHTAVVDWGDGSTDSATVTQGAGFGSLSATHVYTTGGIYTITVTVTDDDGGVGTATDTITVAHHEAIEVKPNDDDPAGTDRNPINLKTGGVTPVAILGSAEFDVRDVDVSTVRFGDPEDVDAGAGASARLNGDFDDDDRYEDVNGDGILDLVLHFDTQDLGFEDGDTVGKMVGLTDAGVPFFGTDDVDAFLPGNGDDADTDDADADDADESDEDEDDEDNDDDDDDEKKGNGKAKGRND